MVINAELLETAYMRPAVRIQIPIFEKAIPCAAMKMKHYSRAHVLALPQGSYASAPTPSHENPVSSSLFPLSYFPKLLKCGWSLLPHFCPSYLNKTASPPTFPTVCCIRNGKSVVTSFFRWRRATERAISPQPPHFLAAMGFLLASKKLRSSIHSVLLALGPVSLFLRY